MGAEINIILSGFWGGLIASMFILSVTQIYWKLTIKKYNKSRPDDIDALRMRICSLETIINGELNEVLK